MKWLLVLGPAAGLVAAALVIWATSDGGDRDAFPVDVAACRGLAAEDGRDCYTRRFLALVRDEDDPRQAVAAIAAAARREGGSLLTTCHGVMHTVGRTYAREAGVTLESLMQYLPRSNDPGCPAGFAHGIVTAAAPSIDPRRPRDAASVCADAATRYQRYSCVHGFGHAFMRMHGDQLAAALELCGALGPVSAPDCAQGAYHDYWFAVVGADDATLPEGAVTDPRRLCGAQPAAFVQPCWYRAFVDNRPPGVAVEFPVDIERLCDGLEALQRSACVTAASVIGPADPAAQLRICAGLHRPVDAESCIRGTKVQNLLGATTRRLVVLIGACELFAGGTRRACYRWLGKTLAVVTDGAFARAGCPQLEATARRACEAGARTMEEALVTFS